MKISQQRYWALILVSALAVQACKSKKAVVKPQPVAEAKDTTPPPPPPPPPAPEQKPQEPAPAPPKPDFNFSNIQFEFNSAVLKTASYQTLDHVAAEMKKDPSANFVLNGHSSAEGTTEHNMSLSVDRANSVKTYLINGGINGDRLTVKGFGETKPLTSNTSEEGRALNRRVEIKLTR